jgi:pimeloyl-[acyl-carrier protein] synthase
MLFLDPPTHTRIRSLAAAAFTPASVASLRDHIRDIASDLLAAVRPTGRLDVITQLAEPLPAIVTAELLGVPTSDHEQLKEWSAIFAEMLGNFQLNPGGAARVVRALEDMLRYFKSAVREQLKSGGSGLVSALAHAEIDGDRLTEDEVVANIIITMVGGQETTTNLIGNGVLTLLRHPDQFAALRADPTAIPSAVEELLRFEPPSQQTARLARTDCQLGDKEIRQRQAVIAVMAAGNRDPARFPDPDRFDIYRKDNRHLSFGWASHFCFGAPLARLEGQIVFDVLTQRFPDLTLDESKPLVWRENLGLRGLKRLNVTFAGANRN